MQNLCPECSSPIKRNAKTCGCGWEAPQFKAKRTNTHRCAYTVGEERCFNLGSMTSTTKAENDTKWYCVGHLESLENKNPAFGEHVLYESRLDEPETSWHEEEMQRRLKEEPYPKLANETSKQYAVRMMGIISKMKFSHLVGG